MYRTSFYEAYNQNKERKQYQKVQDVFHEQYWPAGAVLHMVDDLFRLVRRKG